MVRETRPATTIAEAQRRADDLRAELTRRDVHADVLHFCRAELLQQNYFHAVREASKGIADKLRSKTGKDGDGSALVDATCSLNSGPLIAFDSLAYQQGALGADGHSHADEGSVLDLPQPDSSRTQGARQIPSDQPGTRRFEHPLSLVPAYSGLRFYTFPGGCATYRFSFTPGTSPALAVAVDNALAFQSRSTLVNYVRHTEGLMLCGRDAACPR